MAKIINPLFLELLRDLQQLTSQEFCHDPIWRGVWPATKGDRESVRFADLDQPDKADILRYFFDWERYERQGLAKRDADAIQKNITHGKPRAEWLDGTSLTDPDRKMSLADLKAKGHEKQPKRPKSRDKGLER